MIKLGQIVNVQAYKHDGTLYRQWNGAKVIHVSPDIITLFMFKTKVLDKSKQKWVIKEPIIWWMPTHEFYNTTGLVRDTGTHYYTNLASPPIYEDKTIKYIDYDLDIKHYPGTKTKVVDKLEFQENSRVMNYSQKLKDTVIATQDRLLEMIKDEQKHFSPKTVSWILDYLFENKLISKKSYAALKKIKNTKQKKD